MNFIQKWSRAREATQRHSVRSARIRRQRSAAIEATGKNREKIGKGMRLQAILQCKGSLVAMAGSDPRIPLWAGNASTKLMGWATAVHGGQRKGFPAGVL
mmetsp:Transcript_39481/g.93682  ORF Transcript_39481/g.93682 Transcript_39481/m.93682 type:complete len:100 (-) Transcript_39481:982-1281(-)